MSESDGFITHESQLHSEDNHDDEDPEFFQIKESSAVPPTLTKRNKRRKKCGIFIVPNRAPVTSKTFMRSYTPPYTPYDSSDSSNYDSDGRPAFLSGGGLPPSELPQADHGSAPSDESDPPSDDSDYGSPLPARALSAAAPVSSPRPGSGSDSD
jgi:hypothetical protein